MCNRLTYIGQGSCASDNGCTHVLHHAVQSSRQQAFLAPTMINGGRMCARGTCNSCAIEGKLHMALCSDQLEVKAR